MSRIAFWNLERLGEGTDADRKSGLKQLVGYWQPDLLLTCELTTKCTFPTPQNLTYRKEDSAQLCYGAQNPDGTDVQLSHVTPNATADYWNCGFKGGNDFTKLADRAIGSCTFAAGGRNVDVYVIHAPSGESCGTKAMAFIAASIQSHYAAGGDWIVVGDFNVSPTALGKVPVPNITTIIKNSGNSTHYSRNWNSYSELDYAMSNIAGLKVRTLRHCMWKNLSDHGPILLEF